MTYKILQGDNRETLKTLADNSIDAIVTDPPYGIDFLGKSWDANTGALETYQECLRVLKPGGHILAFSAARTYHHLAVTLEQAGFEIRDQIMWIYSSGFPKSQDIGKSIERSEQKVKNKSLMIPANNSNSVSINTKCSKCDKPHGTITLTKKCNHNDCPVLAKLKPADNEWSGWGTALKPAHEPIALARKPMKLSIAKNAQKWGTGALNIDATRVEFAEDDDPNATFAGGGTNWHQAITQEETDARASLEDRKAFSSDKGRFPSNVLGEILQADYQKYFYCPKVSRKERHMGHTLDIDRGKMVEIMGGYWCDDNGTPGTDGKSVWLPHTGLIYAHGLTQVYSDWCKNNNKESGNVGNNHPTVKPVALMEYLIKLVTPPDGTVLDPFNGSGSTGMAAVGLGYNYVGCELDANYVEISKKRIDAWLKNVDPLTASGLFEDEE